MKDMIPEKITGFRSDVINGLIDCVTALWPKRSATLLVNVGTNGTSYEVKAPGRSAGKKWLQPFDISDQAATTFSIMDNKGKTTGVQILGVRPVVAAGAGFTWDTDRWESDAVTEDVYVYLKVDRAAVSAELVMGASVPDGTDTERYMALWFIPFSSDAIQWANVVERPEVYSIEGMV